MHKAGDGSRCKTSAGSQQARRLQRSALSRLLVERFHNWPYKGAWVRLVTLMVNQYKQIGGEPVHIRDCYVWAEIYYLDSKTDYREYLPERPRTLPECELVMLDSSREVPDPNSIVSLALPLAVVVLSGLFIYLVLCW